MKTVAVTLVVQSRGVVSAKSVVVNVSAVLWLTVVDVTSASKEPTTCRAKMRSAVKLASVTSVGRRTRFVTKLQELVTVNHA